MTLQVSALLIFTLRRPISMKFRSFVIRFGRIQLGMAHLKGLSILV